MQISLQQVSPTQVSTPLLAIGVFEDAPHLTSDGNSIDTALGGLIGQLISDKEITGKQNQLTVVHTHGKIQAQRVAVVGLGKRADFGPDSVRQASATTAKKAESIRITKYATLLLGAGESSVSPEIIASALSEGATLGLYKYEQFKHAAEEPPTEIQEISIIVANRNDVDAVKRGIDRGETIARGTNLARDLSNGPPNLVTPEYMADAARSIAKRLGFTCDVFGVDELQKRKMGAILAVGEGSIHPPCLIVMRYQGAPNVNKTFAAVGKGITFDSGGLDLKPGDSMLKMKHDMSGAAAVIGFVQAIAELKLPVNVLGLAPTAENMPSNKAYRPSDVITASNGKTIEVTSTDAEGRLVLADALGYAVEQKANAIVDLATLTGACIIALGSIASGIMGNNAELLKLVEKAGERTGERVWPLPLWKEYGEQIKSDIADLQNTGGRWAGAITAGSFLQEFVDKTPWVHIDIAGTAYISSGDQPYFPKDRPYNPRGATGTGVRLLVDLVQEWMKGA